MPGAFRSTQTSRSRFISGIAVLASFAAVAGVGGLVVAGPRDAVRAMGIEQRLIAIDNSPIRIHPRTTVGQSCDECHVVDRTTSHPVDVTPSMRVPAGLPLENSRVTCLTCHTDPSTASPPSAAMLRGSGSVAALCAQCHTGAASPGHGVHGNSLIRAHLAGDLGHRGPAGSGRAGDLDSESQSCMACHDGSVAGDAGSHLSDRGRGDFGEQDHPIGMVYSESHAKNPDVRLVPKSRLSKQVRLFDQAVGCGSCHNVYSKQPKLLVMSNHGSQLCLSCHVE